MFDPLKLSLNAIEIRSFSVSTTRYINTVFGLSVGHGWIDKQYCMEMRVEIDTNVQFDITYRHDCEFALKSQFCAGDVQSSRVKPWLVTRTNARIVFSTRSYV